MQYSIYSEVQYSMYSEVQYSIYSELQYSMYSAGPTPTTGSQWNVPVRS